MTKDELKQIVEELDLDSEVESLIFELIDTAPQVNKALLDAVSQMIDSEADFYERTAEVMEDMAAQYDDLDEEMKQLDQAEYKEKLEAIKNNQEELLAKLEELVPSTSTVNASSAPAASSEPENSMDALKKVIQEQAQTPSTT